MSVQSVLLSEDHFVLTRPALPAHYAFQTDSPVLRGRTMRAVFLCASLTFSVLGACDTSAQAKTSHSTHSEGGIGGVFNAIGHGITSVFFPAPAAAHAHPRPRRRHRIIHRRPVTPAVPQPGFAVPEGTIAAHALTSSDSTFHLLEWDGQTATLQTATRATKPLWMAVLVDGSQLTQACSAGWIRPLDDSTTCGLPGGVSDLVLTWDRSRLTTAPTWQDFWDVARHPGRRGLHFGARTTLEIALLADGVAPQDIYSTLATQPGVDRAFRKLELLRPYIVWWNTPADAARIMEQSSALMLSAPSTEVSSVSSRVQEGAATSLFVAGTRDVLRTRLFWAIPANVPDENAHQTLLRLRMHAPHLGDMPSPVTPTFLDVSDAFWTERGTALEQQFADRFGARAP